MQVHILWHIHHFDLPVGVPHQVDGEPVEYNEGTDDEKLIGVYSDLAEVDAAIQRTRLLEGFSDEPNCFMVSEYTLNQDHWDEGFFTD